MTFDEQQFKEIVEKSKKILLITRQDSKEDSVASLLAAGFLLEKMGKEIDMVTSGEVLPALSFLPKSQEVKNNLESSRTFVISLDTSATKVSQLYYDFNEDGNLLNIYITPKNGVFEPRHVQAQKAGYIYDLIFIVNCPNLEKLGKIYKENKQLFFEVPIINIDNSADNEEYGEINLVDKSASACAEIIFEVFEKINNQLVDKSIATTVLTGIISATKSFQAPDITPKTFNIAAKLIAKGADQQEIVKNIFKNKTLSTLKLLGRALARVQFSKEMKLAWTVLTNQDFTKTSVPCGNLEGIEGELIGLLPDSESVLVLYEKGDNLIEGVIKTTNLELKSLLAKEAHIKQRGELLYLDMGAISLIDAERQVIEKMRSMLGKESMIF